MKIREKPMHVNKETTAFDLLEYLTDLEEVLQEGGRIAAIPEEPLIQLKSEFFEIRDLVKGRMLLSSEWHQLFTFIDHVGKMLSYFEEVAGKIPPERNSSGPER
jgi:hypothetical protein